MPHKDASINSARRRCCSSVPDRVPQDRFSEREARGATRDEQGRASDVVVRLGVSFGYATSMIVRAAISAARL
jgi:hypothetical protein